jgi:hypothetical protein
MYHAGGGRESVIYDGRRQVFVEWKDQIQPEIELIDASVKFQDSILESLMLESTRRRAERGNQKT